MSSIILDHLLNSFYAIEKLKLENIEWLMLLNASEKYKCSKTRDYCIKKIRTSFETPDSITLIISLDIIQKYSEVNPSFEVILNSNTIPESTRSSGLFSRNGINVHDWN